MADEEYHEYIKKRLDNLLPILTAASVGDFSKNLEIPEADDQFTEVYVGIQLMLEAIREKVAELEFNLEEKSAILYGMGEGLIATDGIGNIIYINEAAKYLLHLANLNVINQPLSEVAPIEDEKQVLLDPKSRPVALALSTKKAISGNFYYRRPDKTKFPVNLTITPLNKQGRLYGTIEVFKDITREKEVQRLKDEFMAKASHELFTPLVIIGNLAHMLLKKEYGELPVQAAEKMELIEKSNDHLKKLISNLLAVFKSYR